MSVLKILKQRLGTDQEESTTRDIIQLIATNEKADIRQCGLPNIEGGTLTRVQNHSEAAESAESVVERVCM